MCRDIAMREARGERVGPGRGQACRMAIHAESLAYSAFHKRIV